MEKFKHSFIIAFGFCIIISLTNISGQEIEEQKPVTPEIQSSIEAIQGEVIQVKSLASEVKTSLGAFKKEVDLLWLCIAAFLVFFMQAGFAFVEAGFTRQKNTVNILMKNLSDFTIGSLAFWFIGFSLMFAPQIFSGFGLGMPSLMDSNLMATEGKPDPFKYGFLLFQLVFAGTATTIASGAMAERTKFISYLIYSFAMTALIYPVFGSFAWASLYDPNNKGFLENMGFIDFAGSTVVHSIGGWAGLAGTIVLKPRLERYHGKKIEPIFGHDMSMATLGAFILWFGWFGFNPGSTGKLEGGNFAVIAVTTNMAAAAGAISAMITSWLVFKLPDIGITLNGGLAGLVAITAGCNNVSVNSAILIGIVAGILVVFGVILLDKLHIDDPVGAVSVHGLGGAWGTLAVGLFAESRFGGGPDGLFFGGGFGQLGVQSVGVVSAFFWAISSSFVVFFILKKTFGLRVSEDEEITGLDLLEHGNEAYPVSK